MKVIHMKHEAELNFFQRFLKNSHIPCRIVTSLSDRINELDTGLRDLLNPNDNLEKKLFGLFDLCAPNKVYRILDEFMLHYLFFRLPDTDIPSFAVVGPYTLKGFTDKEIHRAVEKYSLTAEESAHVEKLFYNIPIVAESGLITLVCTLGESLWGDIDNFSIQYVQNSAFFDIEPVARRPQRADGTDAFLSMKILEERYSIENQLMQAVSLGQQHKAEMLLSKFTFSQIESRAASPIRNYKNYMVIANTLLRKAAEAGSVHPLHIDSLSSRFALSIEQACSEDDIHNLIGEMVRKYCQLVKNHSMKGYSLLVQKILVRIDSDLTADLSLKAQADFLDVNPSYLSTLFKKETGATLTEYVNRKRIEHGIFLLNTTNMQIQEIARQCGIADVNYFTKTFKKIVGKTPKEYRNKIPPYIRDAADEPPSCRTNI